MIVELRASSTMRSNVGVILFLSHKLYRCDTAGSMQPLDELIAFCRSVSCHLLGVGCGPHGYVM